MKSPQSRRVHELDGLRGWAALCVVLFHFFYEIFGVIHPVLRNLFMSVALDSSVAVSIFFVLSGEALASAYFAGNRNFATAKLAIKRYPRLVIPIFATCIIVYLLVQAGLTFNSEAAVIVNRTDWLAQTPSPNLTIVAVLKYSFFIVFQHEFPSTDIDMFLWTMRLELLGSILVFVVLGLWSFLPKPRLLLWCGFGILLLAPSATAVQLSCFLAGMIFTDLRARGYLTLLQAKIPSLVTWSLIAAVGVADGLCQWQHIDAKSGWFASALLLFVFCNRSASKFFASPLSRKLGTISFPLYLMQFPVMISFTSWAIVLAADRHTLSLPACLFISVVSTGLSLFAAWVFLPVESLTRYVGNKLVGVVLPIFQISAIQAREL